MKASRGNAVVPDTETPEARMPGIRAPKNLTPEPAGTGWPRGPLFAYLAALAAAAAIPIHLYWTLGGTWGLPGGAATADLPGIHATNLAVSVLLGCGALFLLGLTRPGRAGPRPCLCSRRCGLARWCASRTPCSASLLRACTWRACMPRSAGPSMS
jgi:hypothetical protein